MGSMNIDILINILMMGIASISALVAFAVYRSSTDPEVIVFVDLDHKRPSIINLKIKNIGRASAKNIQFVSDRPLPHKAMGIEVPEEMPKVMDAGPIIIGIPYLAPGQELTLTWGQYGGLKKMVGIKPISMTSNYERVQKMFFQRRELEHTSLLDIESFGAIYNPDHNWDKKTAIELEKITKVLEKLVAATKTK
jgi:hypothetical protein